MIKWIEKNKIFEEVFGEFSHLEIIKKSMYFLKFLYENQRLNTDRLQILFDIATGKHDVV